MAGLPCRMGVRLVFLSASRVHGVYLTGLVCVHLCLIGDAGGGGAVVSPPVQRLVPSGARG